MSTPTKLYCVTCKTTGKLYVGITTSAVSRRWRQHVRASKFLANKFHAAIQQYGAGDFEVDLMFIYPTTESAVEAETSLIDALNLIAEGYNTSPGGTILSAESRAKMSATKTGRKLTPEHRAKIGDATRGIKRSAETKQRMSISQLTACLSRASRGPHSEETRAKMSLAATGRKLTPEHCALMSAARKGRPLSIETRIRMSEAQRQRWAFKESGAPL